MASRSASRRRQALEARGALHPHPQDVRDPLFRDSAFFDPHDVVQVKYEMLRRVRTGASPAIEAAAEFGLSRPAYYLAREAFTREGLPGLLPRKRGPKQPHKLTDAVMAALTAERTAEGDLPTPAALAVVLHERWGITAHPRSIARRLVWYLEHQEKKRP